MWVSSAATGPSFALRYPHIVMHAISRDPASYAQPCIYLQLDEGSEDMRMQGGEGSEDGGEQEEEEEEVAAEVRLVPADQDKGADLGAIPHLVGLSGRSDRGEGDARKGGSTSISAGGGTDRDA